MKFWGMFDFKLLIFLKIGSGYLYLLPKQISVIILFGTKKCFRKNNMFLHSTEHSSRTLYKL